MKKKKMWMILAAIVLLIAGLFTVCFLLFHGLTKVSWEESLLQIDSAVDRFHSLTNGELSQQSQSRSDESQNQDLNYQEYTNLTFVRKGEGYDYLLQQQDQNHQTTFTVKCIDGQGYLDQGNGFEPYEIKETSLPVALSMMEVKPQIKDVKKIKQSVREGEKIFTVYYRVNQMEKDGISLRNMVRIYHLQEDGLLYQTQEILEGILTENGKKQSVRKESTVTLNQYNQEEISLK